jgi:hypothetical protein
MGVRITIKLWPSGCFGASTFSATLIALRDLLCWLHLKRKPVNWQLGRLGKKAQILGVTLSVHPASFAVQTGQSE